MSQNLIIGLGGAGCSIAEKLQASLDVPAVAVNTDSRALKRCDLSQKLLLGQKSTSGPRRYGPRAGQLAAEASVQELSSLLTGVEQLILVAGLGGATGSGGIPVIARLAQERGLRIVAAVTLPFSFEDARQPIAQVALQELRMLAIEMVVYDHSKEMHLQTDESFLSYLATVARTIQVRVQAEI